MVHYCKFCCPFSQNGPIILCFEETAGKLVKREIVAAVSMQAGRDESREGASFEEHLRKNGEDGKLQSSSSSWVHKNVKRGEEKPNPASILFVSVSLCNTECVLKGENKDIEGNFASQDWKWRCDGIGRAVRGW